MQASRWYCGTHTCVAADRSSRYNPMHVAIRATITAVRQECEVVDKTVQICDQHQEATSRRVLD